MGLRINMMKIIFLMLFCTVSMATKSDAVWQGPAEILSGGWGSDSGQFGINYGDSGDQLPSMLVISSTGKILIGDSINKRIQVFNENGTFSNLIMPKGFPASYPPVTQWPLSLFICGDSSIYTRRNEYLQIFSISGDLLQNFTTIRGGIAFIDEQCNFYTYNQSQNIYSLYSPTGQLIKTMATRPLEMGKVNSDKLGENGYKITITYPDKAFGLTSDRKFSGYVRDKNGHVYGVNTGGVWRFNQCGKSEGTVLMPGAQVSQVPRQGSVEPIVTVSSEYGKPVVALNGDVYTWKRTSDKYAILKWTWVDDPSVITGPDAPTGLTLMPSTTGLYLTWTASPSDPGCVTEYEVSRATSAGGVGTTVATVNAGVVKYNDTTATVGTTYYYKVRAVAGSEYSTYTSEVSGKR